ncbi:MAG: glycosyltransferase, partial [Verrucomicrobiota bacterium]
CIYGPSIENRPFKPDDPTWLLRVSLMRKAAARAEAVVIHWWNRNWLAGFRLLRDLNLMDRLVHIPLVMDDGQFAPDPDFDRAVWFQRQSIRVEEDELILFHPVRQLLNPNLGQTDQLFRALGVLKRRHIPFRLIMVEKGIPDEKIAREIMDEEGITDRVQWIGQMERRHLVDGFRAADITVEKLGSGVFGSTGLEALACGCPLMSFVRTEDEDETFWCPSNLPPVINVSSQNEIVEALTRYARARDELKAVGEASRSWFVEQSAPEPVCEQYLELYRGLPGQSREGLMTMPDREEMNEAAERVSQRMDEHASGLSSEENDLLALAEYYASMAFNEKRRVQGLLNERRQNERTGPLVRQLVKRLATKMHLKSENC